VETGDTHLDAVVPHIREVEAFTEPHLVDKTQLYEIVAQSPLNTAVGTFLLRRTAIVDSSRIILEATS
jgi:hypothetical protein